MTSTRQWEDDVKADDDVKTDSVKAGFNKAASPMSHKRIVMAFMMLPGMMSQVGKRKVERLSKGMTGMREAAILRKVCTKTPKYKCAEGRVR